MIEERRGEQQEEHWEPTTFTVPSTWAQIPVAQAFEPISVNNKKIPTKDYLENGLLPVVDQSRSFISGYTDKLDSAIDPAEDGVIVFGDHTRVFKRVNFPFAPGADGIKVLRPRLTTSAYAYYACLSLRFPNKGYSRHYSFLSKCAFPVAPAREQERIVSKIDELFSRIQEGERALERVQTLVERYRQSVLKAAITGELTRAWRQERRGQVESGEALLGRILQARRAAWEAAELERMRVRGVTTKGDSWKQKYKEPVAPDTSGLPEGWVRVTIEHIAECLDNSREPVSATVREGRQGAIPYYGANGQVGTIDDYLFDEPLVLVVEDETFTGRTKPFSYKIEGRSWVNNHAHVLRPTGAVLIDFLHAMLARYPFIPLTTGTTARRKLTQKALMSAPIAIPGLAEQAAIVAQLNQAECSAIPLLREALRSAAAVPALRQSVLRSAFAGELVPQDPTDEPASVLLERIVAERATAPVPKRRQRKAHQS